MSTSASNVIPSSHADLLTGTSLAHVATIGPDGEPQNSPVWFEFEDGNILFSQTKARQKYKNVRREPRIALSIVNPANPYRYLEIRGVVERIDEDPNRDFANAMARKYLNLEAVHQPGEERVVIVVRPEHTTTMG